MIIPTHDLKGKRRCNNRSLTKLIYETDCKDWLPVTIRQNMLAIKDDVKENYGYSAIWDLLDFTGL